ncbi:hypothetical protein [Streptomyces sp. B8F3]|uniref:hypothetical protein n=1 Tax=unclassified Streptomyces TaxID=2593676 RepID=UPI00325ED0DF
MCAGARLDEGFARRVVEELLHQRYRARASSPGVYLEAVRAHAERTLRDLRRRDLAVGTAFLLSLALAPVVTVVYWVGTALLSGSHGAEPLSVLGRRRDPDSPHPDSNVRAVVLALLMSAGLLLIGTLGSAGLPVWLNSEPIAVFLLTLILLVVFPWIMTWGQRDAARRAIREELTPESFQAFRGDGRGRRARPLDPAALADNTNLILYRGFQPFVGAGDEVTSWSFAMRLRPEDQALGSGPETEREQSPVSFDTDELVRRLAADLDALRTATASATERIPGLEVTEKVFVRGTELRQNALLPDHVYWPDAAGRWPPEGPPADRLSPEYVALARGRIDGPVRHCLCAQVRSWGTDLVLSVYVQVAVSGATLYLQANALVLTPVREEYRVADSIADPSAADTVSPGLADALLHSRGVLVSALSHAFSELRTPARRRRRLQDERKAVEIDRRFDFGAGQSLREAASSHAYRDFFQKTDVNRITKQIDEQLFESVASFLSEHGLDLGDLRQQRNVILNQGIMMTGGSMSGSMAAGAGATAVAEGLRPQAPTGGARAGGAPAGGAPGKAGGGAA